MTGQELTHWGDAAMYRSEPMPASAYRGPSVVLLNVTPDPLGSLAALVAIYQGRVVRSLSELTDEDRREALEAMLKTELNGALESIQFHLLFEGVTRAWTHQAVRERHAFIAQESMRFAVVEDESWTQRARPAPSIEHDSLKLIWEQAMDAAQDAYTELIHAGVPAEDARGVMPHDMTTRLHMVLSFRTLLHLAGLRLCTQAQFEWRAVMAQVVKSIRNHSIYPAQGSTVYDKEWAATAWQFELIADTLQPICYQRGRCGFMAAFDRDCTIRDRVEANAKIGRPSHEWGRRLVRDFSSGNFTDLQGQPNIEPIEPREWMTDPAAARRS